MTRTHPRRTVAALFALALACMGALSAPGPARAMQILDAADHAELAAEISAAGVNRIALSGDRIAKVVRAPDGFAVEHDAASGDLYLRPAHPFPPGETSAHEPVTLFVGTEKGFTYRLTLTPADRESAQILIRNAAVLPGMAEGPGIVSPAAKGDAHVAALVRLVRAVARHETLPGYAIEAGGGPSPDGLTLIETWRGPRLRRWSSRPRVRRPTVRTGPRASPGPSQGGQASGALPRSGWPRRSPDRQAAAWSWR